jgi:hypothetical protein
LVALTAFVHFRAGTVATEAYAAMLGERGVCRRLSPQTLSVVKDNEESELSRYRTLRIKIDARRP